jgi:hypothetical protein
MIATRLGARMLSLKGMPVRPPRTRSRAPGFSALASRAAGLRRASLLGLGSKGTA